MGHLLCAHGRDLDRGFDIRAARGARLLCDFGGGRALRESEAGAGSRKLRAGRAALYTAGLRRRHDIRQADREEQGRERASRGPEAAGRGEVAGRSIQGEQGRRGRDGGAGHDPDTCGEATIRSQLLLIFEPPIPVRGWVVFFWGGVMWRYRKVTFTLQAHMLVIS